MSDSQTAEFVVALMLLVGASQLFGQLLVRMRQPRVVGEIVGGVVLGPTLLAAVAPDLQRDLIPPDGPVADAIAACAQLGLILLMFAAGQQLRIDRGRSEFRVSVILATVGTALPFAGGIALALCFDLSAYEGAAQHSGALMLVLAASFAVTSIPVISRIMFDLGLMRTSFATVVLGAAVMEDVLLYAVLSVAVALAQGSAGGGFGLAVELGIDPASAAGVAYHAVTTASILALGLASHGQRVRRSRLGRALAVARGSVAGQLLVLLALSGACLGVGVVPVFGGLVSGIVLAPDTAEDREAATVVSQFAMALFVPLYFALVGLKLDLARDAELLLIVWVIGLAWLLKSASVLLGARLANQPRDRARHFAVAMNARGGPGIILATVGLQEGIIDRRLYLTLVLLAILTSMFAGWWLRRALDADPAFADADPAAGRSPAGRRDPALSAGGPGGSP